MMSCAYVPRAPPGARVAHLLAYRVGPRQLVHSIPHRAPADAMDHVGAPGVASRPSTSDARRPAPDPACATTTRHARGQQPDQRARPAWLGAVPRDAHPTRPRAQRGRSTGGLWTPHQRAVPSHRPRPGRHSAPRAPISSRDRAYEGAASPALYSRRPSKNSTLSVCRSVTYRCWPPSSSTHCPSPIDHVPRAAGPARHRLRSARRV